MRVASEFYWPKLVNQRTPEVEMCMKENIIVYNNFILAKRSNNHKVDCWKRSYYLQSMVLPNGQTCLETCLTSTDALIRKFSLIRQHVFDRFEETWKAATILQ